MPPISRVTDTGSGHVSFPPTDAIEGSPNVFSTGQAVYRKGDHLEQHGSPSPSPPHPRPAAKGSSTVFTNSLDTMRIGDPIACGGVMVTGEPTVIVGG